MVGRRGGGGRWDEIMDWNIRRGCGNGLVIFIVEIGVEVGGE